MTALLLLFARLFIIYLIIKVLWSLLSNKKNFFSTNKKEEKENLKRYSSEKEKIEDAEFEEIE